MSGLNEMMSRVNSADHGVRWMLVSVNSWVQGELEGVEQYDGWAAGMWLRLQSIFTYSSIVAFLLETCILLPKLGPPCLNTYPIIMSILSRILKPASSSSYPSSCPPNSHVLVLRCLLALPHHLWDGQLCHADMKVIMEGLNSPDDTVRSLVCYLIELKIEDAECSSDAQATLSIVPRLT